jgi:tetratricopeptide (TPR) repeat protein
MTQPENASAWHRDAPSICYIGGNVLRDLDCMEAALDAYDQAIQLVPGEASFYHHKAHILEQLGRLAESKRAYEQAERLGYNG